MLGFMRVIFLPLIHHSYMPFSLWALLIANDLERELPPEIALVLPFTR